MLKANTARPLRLLFVTLPTNTGLENLKNLENLDRPSRAGRAGSATGTASVTSQAVLPPFQAVAALEREKLPAAPVALVFGQLVSPAAPPVAPPVASVAASIAAPAVAPALAPAVAPAVTALSVAGKRKGSLQCKCGSTTHLRSNHQACPLNKKRRLSTAAAAEPNRAERRRPDTFSAAAATAAATATANVLA